MAEEPWASRFCASCRMSATTATATARYVFGRDQQRPILLYWGVRVSFLAEKLDFGPSQPRTSAIVAASRTVAHHTIVTTQK